MKNIESLTNLKKLSDLFREYQAGLASSMNSVSLPSDEIESEEPKPEGELPQPTNNTNFF